MKISRSLRRFLGSERKVYSISAPGRLDVMGGIADYSGSLVLEMPIRERTTVSMALRDDHVLRVCSQTAKEMGEESEITLDLPAFVEKTKGLDYSLIKSVLLDYPGGEWAGYVLGGVFLLIREKKIPFKGADFFIESTIPIGKGVSSSAAIEVATLALLAHVFQIELDETELPRLAQRVENHIVGAPCGLMDQLTSYFGRENQLTPILCQPDHLHSDIGIPQDIYFMGIDSGVRHTVSGASYSDVRIGAFMGYTMIALHEGVKKEDLLRAKESGDTARLPYQGYLANICPSLFYRRYHEILPEKISGKDFIRKYTDTIDSVTKVDPKATYAVRMCTLHPIEENQRVHTFALLLKAINKMPRTPGLIKYCQTLGELMFQSHASYSRCGLGSERTDELVDRVISSPKSKQGGVFGAKITGGGSGGTVCLLCLKKKGLAQAKQIAQEYSSKYGMKPVVFTGSSDGVKGQRVKVFST